VVKLTVWLSGLLGSYEQVAQVLKQVGQIEISKSSVWQLLQRCGEQIRQVEQQQREQASRQAVVGERPPARVAEQERMGLALDGAMVNVREEGWKELKLGCVFEIKPPDEGETVDDEVEVSRAVNNSYVGYLGGPAALGQLVWLEAQRRGWEQAAETQVVGDGASWIWNITAHHFYDSRQVVDWYHASQHLYQAAQALHGEGTAATQQWYQCHKTKLYQGHADNLSHQLQQLALQQPHVAELLNREAGYFRNNAHRMQYLELREDGFLIGSGMVESGAKQFKARLTGPGMRWSRDGLERLIPVRAAVLSNRFDEVWSQARNSPPN
jgi:hypothetical protein